MNPTICSLTGAAAQTELVNIAHWWCQHMCDHQHGGFYGQINQRLEIVPNASKGIVQNSRILWFYSELALSQDNAEYRQMAVRAYDYIVRHFEDKQWGGAYWSVEYDGSLLDDKKQTYAQSFCIYAFCSFYRLTGDLEVKQRAWRYFDVLQQHCRDYKDGGYIEAFKCDWQGIDDNRLSDKDLNLPKSMNTHLHVLEAITALHQIDPVDTSRDALEHTLQMFDQHIVDHQQGHLKLFFQRDWQDCSRSWSFGHDIEASWLIWEAAGVLYGEKVPPHYRQITLQLAEQCLRQAVGQHGQICDEFEFASQQRKDASVWWVQAEALVGFVNAWQLSGQQDYRQAAENVWGFIQQYHLDHQYGEWRWWSGLDQGDPLQCYQAGFWKAPYHNGRAMMELVKRLKESS